MPTPAVKGAIRGYAEKVLVPLLSGPADFLGGMWSGNTLLLYVTPEAFQELFDAVQANQAFNKVVSYFARLRAHPEDVVVRVAAPGSRQIEDQAFLAQLT